VLRNETAVVSVLWFAAVAEAVAVPGEPPWSELARRLLRRDMRHFGQESAQIGDAGAVAVVIASDAMTVRRMHVEVELRGAATRGMTVVDQRGFVMPPDKAQLPPNVDVVVDVDAARIKSVFADAVLH